MIKVTCMKTQTHTIMWIAVGQFLEVMHKQNEPQFDIRLSEQVALHVHCPFCINVMIQNSFNLLIIYKL